MHTAVMELGPHSKHTLMVIRLLNFLKQIMPFLPKAMYLPNTIAYIAVYTDNWDCNLLSWQPSHRVLTAV